VSLYFSLFANAFKHKGAALAENYERHFEIMGTWDTTHVKTDNLVFENVLLFNGFMSLTSYFDVMYRY